MPASVKAVANEFLELAHDDRETIDPLQMQKLVYLAQGWRLGLSGHRLFRESIEAWRYGPVVPDLYHSLKSWGAAPIKGFLRQWDEARDKSVIAAYDFEPSEYRVIKNIWRRYGDWPGSRLIELTHEPGGPWHETRRLHPGETDARISRELMEEWFEEQADRAEKANRRYVD